MRARIEIFRHFSVLLTSNLLMSRAYARRAFQFAFFGGSCYKEANSQ